MRSTPCSCAARKTSARDSFSAGATLEGTARIRSSSGAGGRSWAAISYELGIGKGTAQRAVYSLPPKTASALSASACFFKGGWSHSRRPRIKLFVGKVHSVS